MSIEFHARYTQGQVFDLFASRNVPLWWSGPERPGPLEPARPTDQVTVIRALDPAAPLAGLETVEMRWWLVPYFHKTAMGDWRTLCVNAPVETVDTAPTFREAYRSRRCLVPLTSFIEYEQPPGWKKGQSKRRNEIEWAGSDVRFLAGIWDRATPADQPEGLESFAIVTLPAGPDVASIGDREPAVLTLEQGLDWLRLDGSGKDMLTPSLPETLSLKLSPREAIMSAALRRAL